MTREELRRISEEYLKQLAEGKGAKRHDFTALDFMIDDLARGNHEKWCAEKRADGYVYGEVVDDTAKTTNLLVPFDKLPEAKKEDNYRNAKKTIALFLQSGFKLCKRITAEDKEALLESMVEALHDDWVMDKLKRGYTFGEIRNDDPSKGPLTHRDMLPAHVLKQVYPKDYAYDRATAEGVWEELEKLGFVVCYGNNPVSHLSAATC